MSIFSNKNEISNQADIFNELLQKEYFPYENKFKFSWNISPEIEAQLHIPDKEQGELRLHILELFVTTVYPDGGSFSSGGPRVVVTLIIKYTSKYYGYICRELGFVTALMELPEFSQKYWEALKDSKQDFCEAVTNKVYNPIKNNWDKAFRYTVDKNNEFLSNILKDAIYSIDYDKFLHK